MTVTTQRTLTGAADFDIFHGRLILGEKQVKRIEDATRSLTKHLVEVIGIGEDDVFLQGSYANGTAIKPDPEQDDGEYDVDLVVVCARDDAKPEQAISELREAIAANGTYAQKIEDDDRERPCVRLRYADEPIGGFHVDVVPARRTGQSPPLEIPRPGVGWRDTDSEAYSEWCKAQGKSFARTVQMLKRWRDHNQDARGAVKSIVLQVLISEHMPDEAGDADRLAGTLRGISDFLDGYPDAPPPVKNPVMDENLTERWPVEDYKEFRRVVAEAADAAERAVGSDTDDGRRIWRELFGEDFPEPAPAGARDGLDPGEMDLELDYGIPTRLQGTVTIEGRVKEKRGFRGGSIAGLSPLQKQRSLAFKLGTTTIAPPFDVFWKIKNRGGEAEAADGLRGEIVSDWKGSGASRTETTLYTGNHYVEIYVVQNGVCVASSRLDVVIT